MYLTTEIKQDLFQKHWFWQEEKKKPDHLKRK